jgi:predicted ATP-dependent endonuclease of OLD family
MYTEDYFEEHHDLFYKACIKFTVETGADMITCLSAVLQDPCKRNKEKKSDIYIKLAMAAGWSKRQPFPKYMEEAVKWCFPEGDPKSYTGYKAA